MGDARDTAKKKKADEKKAPAKKPAAKAEAKAIGEGRQEVTIPARIHLSRTRGRDDPTRVAARVRIVSTGPSAAQGKASRRLAGSVARPGAGPVPPGGSASSRPR